MSPAKFLLIDIDFFQEDLNYISDFLSFLHIPQHRLSRDEDNDEEEEDGEMPEEARERLLLVSNV